MKNSSLIVPLFFTLLPILGWGQVDLRKGYVLLQEGLTMSRTSEQYCFYEVNALSGVTQKLACTGPINPRSADVLPMVRGADIRRWPQIWMGALKQAILLDNPGQRHPTAFMIQKDRDRGLLFSMSARPQGDPDVFIHPESIRHLVQISHTQALALAGGNDIYLLTADGRAQLVMAGDWHQGLTMGTAVVLAALNVTSANPLQGKFAIADVSGNVAIIQFDGTKSGAASRQVLAQRDVGQTFWPSHLLVRDGHTVVLMGEKDPFSQQNQGAMVLYLDQSLNINRQLDIHLNPPDRGMVRGMGHYYTPLPAEVLGLDLDPDGSPKIIMRHGDDLTDVRIDGKRVILNAGSFIATRLSVAGFDRQSDDIISHFPRTHLLKALPDLGATAPTASVLAMAPGMGATMRAIHGWAETGRGSAGLVVPGTIPANLEQWAVFLSTTTDSRPTMREFVAFANRSPKLLPLLVNTLDFRDRLRFGFFWEGPGIRTRYPFTVDTDRVNLAELLALISARAASCEERLKPI